MTAPTAGQRLAVAVDAPQHSGLDRPLDYLSEQALAPGTLVRVPFGKREVLGVVWDTGADAPAESMALRGIVEHFGALPPLPAAWRSLVEFAAGYYQRGVGELALAVLPAALRDLDAAALERRLKRLRKKIAPPAAPAPAEQASLRPLTEAQSAALDALRAQAAAEPPGVSLLHGVTGSGKTEVYLREAQRVLDGGRQALVLVPEINLTPQLEARFAERFPNRRIVSLHSGLTPAQRLAHWLQALLGEADLVLGTRMAVFAPLPRLGLIVVDEEHDASYKQQDGARYSARDLAVLRGRLERAPVILGSATPSLETWHNALPIADGGAGRYRRLVLAGRVGGGGLPRVRLLDMNQVPREQQRASALAPALMQAIAERIARGEQSLLLLNRRGYSPVLHCLDCSWKSGCPHCSAWRVFHKGDRTLRCHHCGFTERVPRACPDCGNADIQPLGRGTERLEEQLAQALPGARVARLDADTTRHAGALAAGLARVHAGEVDVLVGTQMVAKGHDFRRVTLVAAVQPDAALFSSDFRAPERLFALLLQAAGRAGRDAAHAAASEMWVQTWHPQHALFAALDRHDSEAYAHSQLAERRQAGLPPYAHLALLRADARTQEAARAWLDAAAALGSEAAAAAGVVLYPSVPTPMQRVADVERAQLLIECAARPPLQRFLAGWLPQLQGLKTPRVMRWAIDVDPLAI
ncbi:replication restart helicase PriA [Rivibacter subsaxonicus]|uniref:replication restart helicase PriA n=1 Tax=Rivibacter subsaxonicus TaxID=457575 RepID=UPI00102B5019|nr:primosomal protein N' [Rivibacter subsaxonicus]